MSIFNSPFEYDDKLMEGTVTTVDPIRFICTVRTIKGQFLQEVPWLLPYGGNGKAGIHVSPSVGDQVIVTTALTYPIILGVLPRIGAPDTDLTNATGATLGADAGNNTNMKGGFVANPSKPSDFAPGDHIVTSEGGGVFGALANGSFIVKASGLAQILISKYDDLVRIVARNWERFSDIGQQTVANVKGRMYEYMGWDRSLERAKVNLYELNDVIGDVAAGEELKGEPDPSATLQPVDNRVRKYWLTAQTGEEIMVDVLQEDGKVIVTVQDILATTKAVEQHDKNLYDVKVQNPTSHSQITITPASLTVAHSGGATTIHDAAGVRSSFSGHFVNIDGSGVHMG